MGVVYRGFDTKLNRPVAIKFLSGNLGDADARRRFQREAEMASSLNHPHIVTVYDTGEFEDRQYLVTEFVDGGTLKDWLKERRRSWREILELLTGVADGLAAAHAAGILHRDVKPANILVATNGYAKIADFGLAKLDRSGSAGEDTVTLTEAMTQAGVVVGTIAYMSPEQAAAKPLDPRTDVFSFAIVLYEALSGRRPFEGATQLEVMQHILHSAPAALPEELPAGLRAAVEKALEKDLADRTASMKDLAADLRRAGRQAAPHQPAPRRSWLWATISVLALVAVGGWWLTMRSASAAPIRSIAVLPLENLSGNPDQAYFSDGITEDLIESLAQVHALRVISRTSVMRYKGTTEGIQKIGKELGADAIIEGSVRRSGDSVRVTAELIRASTDAHIWANHFDERVSDVLRMEGEVARTIAQQVRAALTPEEQDRMAGAGRPVDPRAQDEFFLGRAGYDVNDAEDFAKAAEHFQQATRIQTDFAPAYAYLALALEDSPERSAEAGAAARKALDLDPHLAEAHTALAGFYANEWNWLEADAEFRHAMDLNPDSLDTCGCYANLLIGLGRLQEAMSVVDHALQVNPYSGNIQMLKGMALYVSRRFADADPYFQRAIDLEPKNVPARALGALTRMQLGKTDDAVKLIDRPPFHGFPIHANILAHAGRRAEAEAILKPFNAGEPNPDWTNAALAYTTLGEKEQALQALAKAIDAKQSVVTVARFDPVFDPLRSDPRFQAQIARLKIPDAH